MATCKSALAEEQPSLNELKWNEMKMKSNQIELIYYNEDIGSQAAVWL